MATIDKSNDIKIGGTLSTAAASNILVHSDEVYDESWGDDGLDQSSVNAELSQEISNSVSDIQKDIDEIHENLDPLTGYIYVNPNTESLLSVTDSDNNVVLNIDSEGLVYAKNVVSGITWDKESKEITLVNADGDEVASIDASDFVIDGMLEDASYDDSTHVLTLTVNTGTTMKEIDVDLTGLVDVYSAGDGLSLSSGTFSVKIDSSSDSYLTVSSSGVKLSGVKAAIDEVASDLSDLQGDVSASASDISSLTAQVNTNTSNISANASAITAEVSRATAAEETLTANLAAEAEARVAADETLQANIDAEATTARAAETANATAISTEATRAQEEEADLLEKIEANSSNISTIMGDSSTEGSIANAVSEALEEAKEYADTMSSAAATSIELDSAATHLTLESSTDASTGATTYTLGESDIASAETLAAVQTQVTTNTSDISLLTAQVSTNASNISSLQTSVDSEVTNRQEAIAALDYDDSLSKGYFVTQVNETDGVISVEKAQVYSSDNSITVSTDDDGSVDLGVSSDALTQYVGENAIAISDVDASNNKTVSLTIASDDILSQSDSGLEATLSLDLDSSAQTISLTGIDDTVISSVDVSDLAGPFKVTSSDEYVFSLIDNSSNRLVSVTAENQVEINDELLSISGYSIKTDTADYIFCITDANNNALFYINKNGTVGFNGLQPIGNTTSGVYSITMGSENIASGEYSTAIGSGSIASGSYSIATSIDSTASGEYSIAIGAYNTASRYFSTAIGAGNTASGYFSTAIGINNTASGTYSTAMGWNTIASTVYDTAMGIFNYTDDTNNTDYYFTIGYGGSEYSRSNAFRITSGGDVYAAGSFNASSADYAEMFEWSDGNPDSEDRVGRFVTLDGENITYADSDSTYILGIVSAAPVVIGDNPIEWHDKFITDEWGRFVYEDIEETMEIPTGEKNEDGNDIMETKTITRTMRKVNPDYDASQSYSDRSRRSEWAAIGMMGKLRVKQDGTLVAGGFCVPSTDGVATYSETAGYYVMNVISDEIALVLFK